VQRNHVGPGEEVVEGGVAEAQHLGQERVRGGVVREDLHAEGAGDAHHVQPDPPGAHHAQRLPVQVEPLQPLDGEVARAGAQPRLVHPAREGEDEREGVLGHRVLAVQRHVAHRDAARRARRRVHVVEPGRPRGDEAEVGETRDHVRRNAGVDEDGDRLGAGRVADAPLVQGMSVEGEIVLRERLAQRVVLPGLVDFEGDDPHSAWFRA
jgi:hypothetical protein